MPLELRGALPLLYFLKLHFASLWFGIEPDILHGKMRYVCFYLGCCLCLKYCFLTYWLVSSLPLRTPVLGTPQSLHWAPVERMLITYLLMEEKIPEMQWLLFSPDQLHVPCTWHDALYLGLTTQIRVAGMAGAPESLRKVCTLRLNPMLAGSD